MSQRKLYLYSPDGKEEGWYMEDKAPAGWLKSDPNISKVLPGDGDGTLKGSDPDEELEEDEETLEELQQQLDDLEEAEEE